MLPTKRQFLLSPGKRVHIAAYAVSTAALLFVLKWLELRLTVISHAYELYVVFLALIFTALGLWLAVKLAKPATVTNMKGTHVDLDEPATPATLPQLSRRELEVLTLLAAGLSNRELAEKLFVSENTVKTHLSKLFTKLEVTRRAQAIDKARKMGIVR